MKVIASGHWPSACSPSISEADAAACAAGRYHAGCVGPRGAVTTTHRPAVTTAAGGAACMARDATGAAACVCPLGSHASPRSVVARDRRALPRAHVTGKASRRSVASSAACGLTTTGVTRLPWRKVLEFAV
jgi:hypothetical protein